MKFGYWSGLYFNTHDDLLVSASAAVHHHFDSMWLPQILALDSVAALAVIASQNPNLNVGVAVVPMQSRGPLSSVLASRGLGESFGRDRIALGLGASHPGVSESHYGLDYSNAVAYADEYLGIVSALRTTGVTGAVEGRFFNVDITLPDPGKSSRILLAALGPKMLRLAARYCDGTVTWMTGPRTLESHTAPTLFGFGKAFNRSDLELVSCLPVCITDEPEAAKSMLRERMQNALGYRSYRRQLNREGVDDIAEIGLIGDEGQIAAKIDRLAAIGVTELVFDVFGTDEDVQRTKSYVATSRTGDSSGS